MSRHEEEIDGERPARHSIRAQKMGVIRDEIDRCERRLVYLRQDLARLRREGEPQLQLGDQPTFAPEWPNQRAPIDRGQ